MPNIGIVSYNVEGLLNKTDDESFLYMLYKFDIICLLETFMTKDVLPANILSQYKRYFTPAKKLSKHGRCSGGVIVFVKHTLKNCVLEIKCKLDNVIT